MQHIHFRTKHADKQVNIKKKGKQRFKPKCQVTERNRVMPQHSTSDKTVHDAELIFQYILLGWLIQNKSVTTLRISNNSYLYGFFFSLLLFQLLSQGGPKSRPRDCIITNFATTDMYIQQKQKSKKNKNRK